MSQRGISSVMSLLLWLRWHLLQQLKSSAGGFCAAVKAAALL
jgi:hypothetical protein